MTGTTSTPMYGVADRKQVAAVFRRVQSARALAHRDPERAKRYTMVASYRAVASSQNIEGGHSTPLGVARAARVAKKKAALKQKAGAALTP